MVFVGFVAALGGGILRDLVIGAVPPLAFDDWRYLAVAAVASVLVFWPAPAAGPAAPHVLLLDAAGLGLFTVTGTLKALEAGVPAVGACLVGMLTAIGGGLARDLFSARSRSCSGGRSTRSPPWSAPSRSASWRGPGSGPLPLAAAAVLMNRVRLIALRLRWSAPVAML